MDNPEVKITNQEKPDTINHNVIEEVREDKSLNISKYIKVNITQDQMTAILAVNIPKDFNQKIDIKMIRNLLIKEGVKFGIQGNNINNIIDKINRSSGLSENVIAARGIPEIEGVDAKIRINKDFTKKTFVIKREKAKPNEIKEKNKSGLFKKLINRDKDTSKNQDNEYIDRQVPARQTFSIVDRGTLLAELILPLEGREGKNIHGDRVWSQEKKSGVRKLNIIADKNVYSKPLTNKIQYYATCTGIGYFIDNKILKVEEKIDGEFKIKISEDKKSAYLSLRGHKGDAKEIDKEEIFKSLQAKKIRYENYIDVIEENISKINNQEVEELHDIEVAKAEEPIHGKDGYLKYYIDINKGDSQFAMDLQRVDFRELNQFQTIEENEIIAEIIPPSKGIKDGINVIGEPIHSKPGKHFTGLEITDCIYQEQNFIKAKKAGHITIRNNRIIINPILAIRGNVDFSVGNINFNGDVIIQGNVFDDFKISSKGDIIVNGYVESAYLYSENDIVIKGGIFGKNSGRIAGKGKINIKFCENAHIESDGDVLIEKHSVQSTIKSKGSVVIGSMKRTGSKGTMLGGNIIAKNSIKAHNIGNDSGGNNIHLILGYDFYILTKIKKIQAKITDIQFRMASIEAKLKDKSLNETSPVKKKLDSQKRVLLKTLNKIMQIQGRLHNELKNENCEGIFILEKLFPNNTIQIIDNRITTKDPIEKKIIRLNQNKKITFENIASAPHGRR